MRLTTKQLGVVVAATFIVIAPERSLTEKSLGPRPPIVLRESLESSPTRIEISFQFPAPKLVVRSAHIRSATVEMEGAVPLAEPGLPDIPYLSSPIAIPECDQIDLSAEARNVQILRGVDVAIVTPVPTEKSAKANALSSTTGDVPGVWARVVDIQHARGQALARIEVFPARVDSRQRIVSCPQEIRVVLTPVNPRGPIAVNAGPLQDALRAVVPNLDGVAPKLNDSQAVLGNARRGPSLNSGTGQVCWCNSPNDDWEAAADYVNDNCAADYLIVVAEELSHGTDADLVDSLATKRAEFNGFNVAIVRMNQIDSAPNNSVSGTPLRIRNLVKRIYDSGTSGHMADGRLGYLLLIGDAINPNGDYILPTYVPYPGDYNGNTVNGELNGSDAFFVLLDGPSDVVPDVLMGRLPVDADQNHWELGNVVGKITTYEPVSASAAWPDKILLMSGGADANFTFAGEGLSGFEGFFDAIETIAAGQRTFEQMHRLAASSDELFSEEVRDSINAGYGIVGLFDHANPVNFANAFFPLHYDVLQNDDSPSLFFSIGSHSGFFDRVATQWCCPNTSYSTIPCKTPSNLIDNCDALAERLIVQPAGAIGVVAYARTNQAVVAQRVFANLFRSLLQHKLGHLGSLVLATKLLTGDEVTSRTLNLLGDPALSVDYRFDSVAGDSLDLAVSGLDIAFTPAQKDFASTASQTIGVKVTNHWKASATSVPVEVWRGPPDELGSSLLNSFTLSSVPAFGQSSWSGSIGSFSVGDHNIYVTVDPDDSLIDPVRTNNVSYRTLHVRDYVTGYPVAAGIGHVGVLDAVLGAPQKLEVTCSGVLYDAEGTSLGFGGPGPAGNVYRSDKRYFVLVTNPVIVREAASQNYHYFDILNATVQDVILLDHGASEGMYAAIRTQEGTSSKIRLHNLEDFPNQTLWTRTIGDVSNHTSPLTKCAMAAGDVTGDGVSDVVYALRPTSSPAADSLGVIDGKTGARVWTAANGTGLVDEPYVRLVDLENDGQLEIITNARVAGTAPEDRIQCYDASGMLLWQEVAGTVNAADLGDHTFHAPADMNHDGVKEVVFAREKRLGIITVSGSSATVSHEVNLTGDRLLHSTPLMADTDGDGRLEVIAFCIVRDHYLNEWSLELQVYDDDLSPIATTTFPWDSSLSGGSNIGPFEPATADMNGDGVFEVIFTTPNAVLHAVHVGTSVGRVDWGSLWGNPMRTGLYEQTLGGTYNEPVAIVNRARVLDGVRFNDGLTVTAPASVQAGINDFLIVHGPLIILGNEADTVRVSVDDLSPPGSYWGGLVYDDSTTRAIVDYCKLDHAETAIIAQGASMDVTNSSIEDCGSYGVVLTGSGSGVDSLYCHNTAIRCVNAAPPMFGFFLTGQSARARMEQCDVSDCYIGILADNQARLYSSALSVKDCGLYGIDFRAAYGSLGGTTVESAGQIALRVENGSEIDASSSTFKIADYGAVLGAEWEPAVTATFSGCTFTANDVGLTIPNGAVTMSGCQISSNNSDGVYCFNGSSVDIAGSTLNDNANGVKADACSPVLTDDTLSNNEVGVYCDSGSNPLLRRNKVWSNDIGIMLVNDGLPDMDDCAGVCPSTCANANSIKSNDPWQVFNDNGLALDAKCNYWGGTPVRSKFYGPIYYSPYLTSDPLPAMMFELPDVPKSYSLAPNYPNPFNPLTTVAFEVPPPGGRIQIRIYNVAGQLVRTLVSDYRAPGRYEMRWNGVNERGGSVASGVYFLEMTAPQFRSTRKMLLIK